LRILQQALQASVPSPVKRAALRILQQALQASVLLGKDADKERYPCR
jgi:hypothetical protein